MATSGCDLNQIECDLRLPPRKRLLAGFIKQNSYGFPSSPLHCLSSSTSTSTSDGSSASTDDQTRSSEELAQASKAAADLAVKVAKAARATADDKAVIASKAVDAAKSALELLASFHVDSVSRKERKNKRVVTVEELARRLNRAIDSSLSVLKDYFGRRNKKRKSVVTNENSVVVTSTMYKKHDVTDFVDSDSSNDDHDVASIVDSDSSNDDDLDRNRLKGKLIFCDKAMKERKSDSHSGVSKPLA